MKSLCMDGGTSYLVTMMAACSPPFSSLDRLASLCCSHYMVGTSGRHQVRGYHDTSQV